MKAITRKNCPYRSNIDDYTKLHEVFDAADGPSIGDGLQLCGPRQIRRAIPDWIHYPDEIQRVMHRVFPCLNSDLKQKHRAEIWAGVIYRYFRMEWSRSDIAADMNLTEAAVNSLIRNIKRAFSGRQANGKGVVGVRRRGNPQWLKQSANITKAA